MNQVVLHLMKRGLLKNISSVNDIAFLNIYHGFDPTAASIHLGNLIGLNALFHLHKSGAQLGTGTALIGDPTGRTDSRADLLKNSITQNALLIENSLGRIFRNLDKKHGTELSRCQVLRNHEWLSTLNIIEYLSDFGKTMRLSTMLRLESVQSRLKSPNGISLAEFCYHTLQAIDFFHLKDRLGCNGQLGGEDQWGNMIAGNDLIKKKCPISEPIVITTPLLLDEKGKKMGKSSGNALWLDPKMTSPYSMFSAFLSFDDKYSIHLAPLLSFESIEEVEGKIKLHTNSPEKGLLQRWLAKSICETLYSTEVAERLENIIQKISSSKYDFDSLDLEIIGHGLVEVYDKESIISLIRKCYPEYSRPSILHIISTGGVKIDGIPISNAKTDLSRLERLHSVSIGKISRLVKLKKL